MALRRKVGVWIGAAMITVLLLITSCCRERGSNCLYDKPCMGAVGVTVHPEDDWGYALNVQIKGPHAPNTKAFAITREDIGDAFVIYGDGRLYAFQPAEFTASLKVKEIYSDSGAKWPDYVFDPTYKLRNLYDLEAFIRQHKHLPGLPSQATISQQGVPLVSTQKALVEKVEELTLYVIALQKELDSLKALLRIQSPAPTYQGLR